MSGLRKNRGYIIDMGHIDGLKTAIKNQDILISYMKFNKGKVGDLIKLIKVLKNPKNQTSGKVKFIVIRLTEWTFLNALLSSKQALYEEFFQLLTHYPHNVYIRENYFYDEFMVTDKLKGLKTPSKIHLLDLLVNYKIYELQKKAEIEQIPFQELLDEMYESADRWNDYPYGKTDSSDNFYSDGNNIYTETENETNSEFPF